MIYYFLIFISSLSSIANGVEIITQKGELHIVNKQISPDGFPRSAVLAGATSDTAAFPGPIIRANKHWHGLFQHGTNWADGPEFVTQCPIIPGNSFKYHFSVPDQAGTYWYHSHFRAQYCDGLRGPLVIYDPEDPHRDLYHVDDENTIITLADWYHRPSPVIIPQRPQADSTLINGLGRWSQGNLTAPLAIINVEQGTRYRFRLVSVSCDPDFQFSIDGHNLTVIEADGVNVKPVKVNTVNILAAQRYSVVFEANQPVGNYWMRALPGASGPQGFDNGINSAILRYKGAPELEPNSTLPLPENVIMLHETDLHFLSPNNQSAVPGRPQPDGADVILDMILGFDQNTGAFMVNNTKFEVPDVPVLLQVLSGAQTAQDLLPKGSVYDFPRNKVIQINLFNNNTVGGPHPFHLHGHTFDVIKSAESDKFNFEDPVRRDTVAVAGNNITSIRFVSDNPGPWILHCHIDWHLVNGLAVVLAEAPKDTKAANPVPRAYILDIEHITLVNILFDSGLGEVVSDLEQHIPRHS
ncbi:hypothetical protein VNI00_015028 [Paramarasmius palmivorus]|uniref:Laccase n=1 Tax=Paramarasmius palmivorus TaxID=297713 RepID=A0AAW0BMQ9_9AGAR